MFNQLHFVRLKTAEKALKEGRLDEAHRLATAPDLCHQRRAKDVVNQLATHFLERAREHYRADRFDEALSDLTKAAAGEVHTDEIDQLRKDVETVRSELKRNEVSRRDRIHAAKRRMERGSLVAGQRILEQASDYDVDARRLRQQFEQRVEEVGDIAQQIGELIAEGQWRQAATRIRQGRTIDAYNQGIAKVEADLCKKVLEAARKSIATGRLSRAGDELDCISSLGSRAPELLELADLLRIAINAREHARNRRYSEARREVLSLQRLIPEAKWTKEAAQVLDKMDDFQTQLCSGPLGEQIDANLPDQEDTTPANGTLAETVAIPGRRPTAGPSVTTGKGYLMLVDGGGSYLIVKTDNASIGRVASEKLADIPLFSDIGERHAQLSRVEDDYFFVASQPAEIGGRQVTQHLLRDGDRVVMGRKAKLSFRIPSMKSGTAVLDLSDTTKMPNDVRRVVLFRHHATIGAGNSAHIRCQHAHPPLVLFERKGKFFVRAKSDGHVDNQALEIRLGEPVEMMGVSFVLQPWQVRSMGTAAI